MSDARLMAGISRTNASLFRRLGVALGDPAAWLEIKGRTIGMVRDLEMDRVGSASRVDEVTTPASHSPRNGLDGDRETAMAQAVTQILRRNKIERVIVDRTTPYIYVWHLQQSEIDTIYEPQFGVLDRRQKTPDEIEKLARVQSITEEVMRIVCERIGSASVGDDGILNIRGETLTSENIRQFAKLEFLKRDHSTDNGAICASVPHVADCHHSGTGPLSTGRPIIVDLFPRDDATSYWGDCTRTVVNGKVSERVARMHRAVKDAKNAAIEMVIPGNTAEQVHQASDNVLLEAGYKQKRGTLTDEPSIQHGTGHGIGLDVHEPILLDIGGGEILSGEVFTVEPGLYGRDDGGVRIEDMVVATEAGPRNLNHLYDGLQWA